MKSINNKGWIETDSKSDLTVNSNFMTANFCSLFNKLLAHTL